MLTSLLLSALTLHYVTVTSGAVQSSKETLTFVMMTKTTGFHTRRYTNTLRNKAKQLNRDTNMAWHSHYQLHTQYVHVRCSTLSHRRFSSTGSCTARVCVPLTLRSRSEATAGL